MSHFYRVTIDCGYGCCIGPESRVSANCQTTMVTLYCQVPLRPYLESRGHNSQKTPHFILAERCEQEVIDSADKKSLFQIHETQLGPDLRLHLEAIV